MLRTKLFKYFSALILVFGALSLWVGVGVIYAGKLVNRATDLVDRIQWDNYDGRSYEGRKIGTTTIFLGDTRVATTVLQENGNRALGTRVSKQVADQVLDNGRPWVGRAFVVKDWFLTKYEPLKDLDGKVIGMLYVGILEAPFIDLQTSVTLRFAGLTVLALIATLVVTLFFAGVLTGPIRRLVEAAREMRGGAYPPAVPATGASRETAELTVAFNEMVQALKQREESLSEANVDLKKVNRNYMATLGFVTHELKTPIASMMNYAYLLRSEKIGDLTEKQKKAVGVIDYTLRCITEMVRHYLNLSRIERDELNPAMTRVAVRAEVIDPLVDAVAPEAEARGMTVETEVGDEIALHADRNMTREVFENLLTNAVKYGRDGGNIRISAKSAVAGRVAFTVRNEGEGIPADKLDSLLRPAAGGEDPHHHRRLPRLRRHVHRRGERVGSRLSGSRGRDDSGRLSISPCAASVRAARENLQGCFPSACSLEAVPDRFWFVLQHGESRGDSSSDRFRPERCSGRGTRRVWLRQGGGTGQKDPGRLDRKAHALLAGLSGGSVGRAHSVLRHPDRRCSAQGLGGDPGPSGRRGRRPVPGDRRQAHRARSAPPDRVIRRAGLRAGPPRILPALRIRAGGPAGPRGALSDTGRARGRLDGASAPPRRDRHRARQGRLLRRPGSARTLARVNG